MNTRLVSLLTAFGLFLTNAAIYGNSAKIGYASDYFYRGSQKAEQSVQSSLRLSHGVGPVNASLHACSNQAVDAGNDSYHMGAGVGSSFIDDLLSAYVGINHFEDVPGNALSEVELRVSLGTVLSPSISAYRDLDAALYTFEVGVSHSFDLKVANLNIDASFGNTELSAASDVDYYNVGAGVSKSISESADLDLSVDYVDADNIDDEFVLSTALTFKF
jgi:hypothetical protein